MIDLFGVTQFFVDDSYETVVKHVAIDEAMSVFKKMCTSVGAKLGTTKRVIVTDGGDCVNLEWEHGKGITYPPELVGKQVQP